jgi:hypothetical protein
VGAWDRELISCPQDLQNLLSKELSAEHFGHWIIVFTEKL